MTNFNHDNDRVNRLGFPEIIYGEYKTVEDLKYILNQHSVKGDNALVTKLQKEKNEILKQHFPGSFYDEVSGIFMLKPVEQKQQDYDVAIISAGTSDKHVVNEIFFTLNFLSIGPGIFADSGVAGVHRITENKEELEKFKVLIVVAGFEGALPSVVGGLFPQPVIAVPTDVGYGVAKGGKTALNAMLSSCANGVVVTNINNGYGAAMAAIRILNLLKR